MDGLTAFQCDDRLGRLRVENAACSAPDGLRFVEGGDESRWWDPCVAVEDEDAGGGAAGEGEAGLS